MCHMDERVKFDYARKLKFSDLTEASGLSAEEITQIIKKLPCPSMVPPSYWEQDLTTFIMMCDGSTYPALAQVRGIGKGRVAQRMCRVGRHLYLYLNGIQYPLNRKATANPPSSKCKVLTAEQEYFISVISNRCYTVLERKGITTFSELEDYCDYNWSKLLDLYGISTSGFCTICKGYADWKKNQLNGEPPA